MVMSVSRNVGAYTALHNVNLTERVRKVRPVGGDNPPRDHRSDEEPDNDRRSETDGAPVVVEPVPGGHVDSVR